MQDRDPTQPGAARARTTTRRRQPLAMPAVRQPDPVRRGPGHPCPGVRARRPGRRRSGGGARSPGRDGRARHLSLVWVGRLGRRRATAASGWCAGGAVTLPLAGLGADVVKIEEPGRGDYVRWSSPYASTGESGPHLALNRGKRSVTLNLKSTAGADILRELAGAADVLVESFRPGVLDRLGVGYAALRTVNRRLVYAAISGYGATGPYVDKAGHDIDY